MIRHRLTLRVENGLDTLPNQRRLIDMKTKMMRLVKKTKPLAMVKGVLTIALFMGVSFSMPGMSFEPHSVKPGVREAYNARLEQARKDMIDGQIKALTKGKKCSKPSAFKGIPSTLLVRRSAGIDTGVVKSVTFDKGYADSKAGKVYVIMACA